MNSDRKSEPAGAAYLIGHVTVRDADKWAEYRAKVPATLAAWGAELIFRGRTRTVLSGTHRHSETVVARFPDAAAIAGWYASPEYQALIPLREQAADLDLICYDT